jgi:hypothetical protein
MTNPAILTPKKTANYSGSLECYDQQSVFERWVRLSLRSKFGEFVPNNRLVLKRACPRSITE